MTDHGKGGKKRELQLVRRSTTAYGFWQSFSPMDWSILERENFLFPRVEHSMLRASALVSNNRIRSSGKLSRD